MENFLREDKFDAGRKAVPGHITEVGLALMRGEGGIRVLLIRRGQGTKRRAGHIPNSSERNAQKEWWDKKHGKE